MPIVADTSEASAGLLLTLGLLTPLASAALAFSGPGKYSLDNAIGLHAFAGNVWGLIAVAAGVLSGMAVVSRSRHALAVDANGQKVIPVHA
jgi:hypothetical protein